jgi:hypothetical protein
MQQILKIINEVMESNASAKHSRCNAVKTDPDTKRNIPRGIPLVITFLYGTYSIIKRAEHS